MSGSAESSGVTDCCMDLVGVAAVVGGCHDGEGGSGGGKVANGGIVATWGIDGIAGEISSEAAMELNKYDKALQARWGTAEEVVVQASHLVIEQQARNHTLTVSQKNNPKIS
ncbi:unnamed protein product [Sphagnum jensenii]|uniref:Uncharacterized protein n=1 Tax=Sphagnum jensenii TaxID=128206 RepID=A0ABP1BRU2_9BRYO